ncbi:hypothetical protein ANANG_G00104000 [Anguilla anguilla]|uniref:Uncharacterized protein n=1 Tax=Anguilla anguilla TaxID=7936 RepID=A0A9D3MJL5_ANGAN|nr:hypothetical protein ANANG_G00104000 [Anguilla anguilla]
MDLCRLRPSAYDVLNRNKAPFMRPVAPGNPGNLPVAFNKMGAVHTQALAPSAPSVMHPGIPLQTGSAQFGCSDSFQQTLILCPPTIQGIPPNPSKPAGYAVRMENTVPLVTQAPPVQPLQIRPGVIPQQTWSNRAQQILVPAWQQVAQVAPPPTTLASDTVAGPQRLGDWSKMRPHGNHYGAMMPQPLLANQMGMSAQPINIGIAHVVWPQPHANKRSKPCQNRSNNFLHNTNVQNSACQSPKIPDAVKVAKEQPCPEAGPEAEPEAQERERRSYCKAGQDPEELTISHKQRQTVIIADSPSPAGSVITISSDTDAEEEEESGPRHSLGECKGSPDCEACQSTLNMERVCSLSSPDSTLSTSSSASAQSSPSPCKRPNSMSDEEQESGCDTVDGSPASDSSGPNESPFMESRYISDGNRNREPRPARIAPATEPASPPCAPWWSRPCACTTTTPSPTSTWSTQP